MIDSFLAFGVRHRLFVLAFLILGSIAAVNGLQSLVLETGSKNLIDKHDPSKIAYDRIVAEFGSDNITTIYLRDKDLWEPEKLALLEELHYSLEELEFVQKVDSLFSITYIRAKEGDIESGPVFSEVPEDPAEIDAAKSNALYNPLIVGNFISEDANVTAINVSVVHDGTTTFNAMAANAIEELIEPVRNNFEEVFQLGSPRIHGEVRTSFYQDMKILGPLSIAVMIFSIVLFLRNGYAALFPFFTAGISILWTFGFMGLLGIPMNLLSAMLPSIIIAIGSTEDTHILATYLHTIANAKDDKEKSAASKRYQATLITMKHMGTPILLTTLTTVIGLGSNIISSVDMVIDFGLAGMMAMSINGVITLLCVPLLLASVGQLKSRVAVKGGGIIGPQAVVFRLFNNLAEKHGNRVLLITGALFVFLVYQASNLYVNNDPISFFKASNPLIHQADTLQKDLSGTQVFYINLDSREANTFKKPENLERIAKIKQFIQTQGAFDKVVGISDYLSMVNQEWKGGMVKDYVVPDSMDLVEQYLLFFSRNDLKNYISHDFQRANMIVRHNIRDSNELKGKLAELDKEIRRITQGEMDHYLVGENLLLLNAAESLLISQLKALLMLVVVIFLLMSVMFVSFRGGLIALVPNVMPIAMSFGIMGFFGLSLNPGTTMIAVIAIGLAIDDTIHLLTRYNNEARLTVDQSLAVRRTFEVEAVPIVATSISLMLGFLVLCGSNFSVIAEFGAISALTMFFALIADLLITQIVIKKVRLVGLWEILSLKIDRSIITGSPLFDDMSSFQVRKAILLSEMQTYDAGEVIIEQGSEGREMWLLLEGTVDVIAREKENTVHLKTLKAGSIFGEVAFVKPIVRTAEIRTTTPVKLIIFDVDRMKTGMRFYPYITTKLNLNIARIIGERLAESNSLLTRSSRASSKSD